MLADRARELLETLEYINIATVGANGTPWNTPVFARHDKQMNFYWSSWKDANHSENIRANSKVFFTLYDSTRKRGDNNKRCLYFSGLAIELSDTSEIQSACDLLYQDEKKALPTDYQADGLKRIYKATPQNCWLNAVSERELTSETVKMRVEVSLNDLRF